MSVFDFPIVIECDKDYCDILNEKVSDYVKILDGLKTKPHLSNYVKDFNEAIKNTKYIKAGIIRSFNWLFKGKTNTAIHHIQKLVTKYKSKLITPILDSYAFRGIDYYRHSSKAPDELYLFKGRICDPNHSFNKEDMFHIPLDKRAVTRTERYSMPGVPCIYLAYNSYVVWQEMQMPAYDTLSISAFRITNKDLLMIDLTYPFQVVKEILENPSDFEKEYDESSAKKVIESMSLFPLVAAVSVKCREKGRFFKSEYAVPQLLMYCLHDNIVGIAYRSNEISTSSNMFATNLAIPIIDYKEHEKFGAIKDKIELTDSLNFGSFVNNFFSDRGIFGDSNPFAKGLGAGNIFNDIRPLSSFNSLIDDWKTRASYDNNILYKDTPFYSFDDYILYLKSFGKVK